MVIDYEPCPECEKAMAQGFTVMEATTAPNEITSREIQTGVYPTGRYVVLKREAAARVFKDINPKVSKVFLNRNVFKQMFAEV